MAAVEATKTDLYVVLGVPKDAKEEQIRSSYKKLALKYHPDKNTDDSEAAAAKFKEVAYAYSILSDPEKRRNYDVAGFEALEQDGLDVELDLANLGTVNTMFAALFSKLGVPIKTTISTNVLDDAMSGRVPIRPLPLGKPVSDRVEKQGAHFYSISITSEQAQSGVAIRAMSSTQSKFKILYFEKDPDSGLQLAVQEDSIKSGKYTTASFFFLHFQVFRLDPSVNTLAVAKDPEAALFKKLEGLQPCEVSALQSGEHIFAVYGDNFFKSASYTIEAFAVPEDSNLKESLREVEAEILAKRDELRTFETEFREVQARFQMLSARYKSEREEVDKLLLKREKVHEMFASGATPMRASSIASTSKSSTSTPITSNGSQPAASTEVENDNDQNEKEKERGSDETPVLGEEVDGESTSQSRKKSKWFGLGGSKKPLGLF